LALHGKGSTVRYRAVDQIEYSSWQTQHFPEKKKAIFEAGKNKLNISTN
jgi:hypothetical protein